MFDVRSTAHVALLDRSSRASQRSSEPWTSAIALGPMEGTTAMFGDEPMVIAGEDDDDDGPNPPALPVQMAATAPVSSSTATASAPMAALVLPPRRGAGPYTVEPPGIVG